MILTVPATNGLDPASHDTRPLPPNAMSQGFSILGDEWSLFLLRFALSGATRYTEFAAHLPISHAVLSGRLDFLVSQGLMSRQQYQSRPPRSGYVLTESGRATWPILAAIWGWERTWVKEHSYETPPMRHTLCGQEITPVLACTACQNPVQASDLTTEWGPSGGWRRSVPEATTRRRSSTRGTSVQHTFYPDTMAVFGNRWSSALLGAALIGLRRFSDFEAALGLPPSLLSSRLTSLCEHGILRQTLAPTRKDHVEYRLTDKGMDFYPVIAMTMSWAERWFGAPEGPTLSSTHKSCGSEFVGRLICSYCSKSLVGAELEYGDTTPESSQS